MLNLNIIMNDEKHIDILISDFYKVSELQSINMMILLIESHYIYDIKIIN